MVRIGDMEEDRADVKEEYAMDDMESKKDVEEEPTENAPLKAEDAEITITGDAKENDISGGDGGQSQKGFRGWFAKSRVKWWIAVVLAFTLIAGILVVTLLTFDLDANKDVDYIDDVPRLMQLWPRPNGPNNLIHFRHGSRPLEGKVWPELTMQLEELLEGYNKELLDRSPHLRQCYVSTAPENSSCFFDIQRIVPFCTKRYNFGYDEGKPCIFLQFTNITGWRPEPYTTLDSVTNVDMPEEVKRKLNPSVAIIHCHGNTKVDTENLGTIEYSPEPGFRLHFFPFENQPDYMPPLVALRFKQPAVGIAIGITCRLWARNLNHTEDAVPNGSLHFNLLIE